MNRTHIHYLMPQGIGDIIMTIPVVKEFSKDKSVFFSITVNSKIEASIIQELCPELDISFIYMQEIYKKTGQFGAFFILIKQIRKLSPDIILTQFNISAIKSSLTSFFSGVKIRVGWKGLFSFLNTLTLSPSGVHKISENLKSLRVLNIDLKNTQIIYPQIQTYSRSANPHLEELMNSTHLKIAISPGSKEQDKHKRWPHSYFSTLINRILINHKNIILFLIGDEKERQLCDLIENNLDKKDNVINIAGKTTIKDLLYLLSKVDLTITNCNGISHMACAVNSTIIGLYGPTDYKITGPISKTFYPITPSIDCAPCHRRDYTTGCDNPVCMEKIDTNTVYQRVKNILHL